MDCHFQDLLDFQSSEARLMTASAAAHTPTHTIIQPTTTSEISVPMTCLDCKSLLGNTKELQTQAPWQYTDHWIQYSLNLWMAEAVINRASELWKSVQIPKMTVHKKILIKFKVLNQIWWSWYYNEERDALSSNDLVKKDNCWSVQSPEKSTVPFLGGHSVYPKTTKSELLFSYKAQNVTTLLHLTDLVQITMNCLCSADEGLPFIYKNCLDLNSLGA